MCTARHKPKGPTQFNNSQGHHDEGRRRRKKVSSALGLCFWGWMCSDLCITWCLSEIYTRTRTSKQTMCSLWNKNGPEHTLHTLVWCKSETWHRIPHCLLMKGLYINKLNTSKKVKLLGVLGIPRVTFTQLRYLSWILMVNTGIFFFPLSLSHSHSCSLVPPDRMATNHTKNSRERREQRT